MGFAIVDIESTPNPDALIFHLDGAICDGTISTGTAGPSDRSDDPTIQALRSIDGVAGLMFHGSFVTVRKEGAADWGPIRAKVKRALKDAQRLERAGF